jgi:hypothetical protein
VLLLRLLYTVHYAYNTNSLQHNTILLQAYVLNHDPSLESPVGTSLLYLVIQQFTASTDGCVRAVAVERLLQPTVNQLTADLNCVAADDQQVVIVLLRQLQRRVLASTSVVGTTSTTTAFAAVTATVGAGVSGAIVAVDYSSDNSLVHDSSTAARSSVSGSAQQGSGSSSSGAIADAVDTTANATAGSKRARFERENDAAVVVTKRSKKAVAAASGWGSSST